MAELITSEDEANKLVDEIKDYAERLENEMPELMTLTLSRLAYLAHGEVACPRFHVQMIKVE